MQQSQDLDREFQGRTRRDRPESQGREGPIYRVGELYHRGHKRWREGVQFTYGPSGPELVMFQGNISEDAIGAVQGGPSEFAMVVDHPLIVLAYRFGNTICWNDVPYCWHLQPPGRRVIPRLDPSPEARALLWVSLVGAGDGIIHAQRGLTVSPSFTFALHAAIRAQAVTKFNAEDCTAAVSRLYLNYLTITDRLPLALVRTMGNE